VGYFFAPKHTELNRFIIGRNRWSNISGEFSKLPVDTFPAIIAYLSDPPLSRSGASPRRTAASPFRVARERCSEKDLAGICIFQDLARDRIRGLIPAKQQRGRRTHQFSRRILRPRHSDSFLGIREPRCAKRKPRLAKDAAKVDGVVLA